MTDAQLLNQAHRKVGRARKLLEAFWARPNAHDPYDRENAWAMHVLVVQLHDFVLKRGATMDELLFEMRSEGR